MMSLFASMVCRGGGGGGGDNLPGSVYCYISATAADITERLSKG